MGTQLPQKKGTAPTQYLVHVCCGQMAGWIKLPFGMEVKLDPGDVLLLVRWGRSSPVLKRGTVPQFSVHVYCGQTAGWMKTPLGKEVDRPRLHCVRRDPAAPRTGTAAPLFSAHVYCGSGRPSQLLLSSCLQNITSFWETCPTEFIVALKLEWPPMGISTSILQTNPTPSEVLDPPLQALDTPWAIKRSQHIFVYQKSMNFNVILSGRFWNEGHMWRCELHPPHLINAACESWKTENVCEHNFSF